MDARADAEALDGWTLVGSYPRRVLRRAELQTGTVAALGLSGALALLVERVEPEAEAADAPATKDATDVWARAAAFADAEAERSERRPRRASRGTRVVRRRAARGVGRRRLPDRRRGGHRDGAARVLERHGRQHVDREVRGEHAERVLGLQARDDEPHLVVASFLFVLFCFVVLFDNPITNSRNKATGGKIDFARRVHLSVSISWNIFRT